MKKGHVFFISGVTGAGKGTVIKSLLQEKVKNLEFVKSVKTRELRAGEVDGVDYIKYSKEAFESAIQSGEFLEYNFVHQQDYYGTRKLDIFENGIEKGKIIIKEVDMLILPKLMENISSERKNFTFIFLDLPISEIKSRMLARGEKVGDKNYQFRVESSIKEKELSYLCDYIINATKSPKEVLEEVKMIVSSI